MFPNVFYIASFFASLFIFYRLVKDDVKLLSLKISENTIFDIFLVIAVFAIVGGRLIYTISSLGSFPLTPLSFILIPYYPGWSVVGAVTFAFGSLFLALRKKHIMKLRIFDLTALSFLPILTVAFLGKLYIVEALVIVLFSVFLIRIYRNPIAISRLNFQGAIVAIFLLVYSTVEILSILVRTKAWLTIELILAMIIFIFATFLASRGILKGYI